MNTDPIIAEIRKMREDIADEHNCDLDAIFDTLRTMEAASDREHIRLPPRRASDAPDAA